MTILKQVVGIDVSLEDCKCNFSVITAELVVKVISSKTFLNTEGGVKDAQKWAKKNAVDGKEIRVVIEASGVYYERFALSLQQDGFYVSVVLPNKAKKYMESLGLKSKNDQIDAKGLAQMGCEQNLEEWTPLSPFFHTLRTYTRLHEDIQQKRTDTSNQLHALKHNAVQVKEAVKILESLIKVFDKELKKIKKKIEDHISTNEDVEKRINHVCSIKGVALLSAATVAAETNGFSLFENIPQLVSFAGFDVIEDQSGKRVGQTRISKKGNSHIRRILYMPAFNMITYQVGSMPALYERTIKKHGIKMKSYVAIQKKLLILIYTLWKKNEDFKKDYHIKKSSNLEEVETSSRVGLEETGKAA
ncbi:MAG TPA: IS110 family transposase [Flavisolibacter sp.]|nr:IS110 family transposase [Flavisolibacter sp.]